MDRPHHAALSDQEIEAFQNALKSIPPLHALQPRFRLKDLIKLGAFVAAFHLLSFSTIEPNDPPLVMTILVRNDGPTWSAFESFPLVIKNDAPWPVPNLEMPPLALKVLVPRNERKPRTDDIANIRVSEGAAPREAPSSPNQISKAVSPAPKTTAQKPPSGSTTQTPHPVSFTNFFSALSAALKTQSQTLSNAPSRTITAPSRDNFAPNKSTATPSPSSSGGLLSGLRKG